MAVVMAPSTEALVTKAIHYKQPIEITRSATIAPVPDEHGVVALRPIMVIRYSVSFTLNGKSQQWIWEEIVHERNGVFDLSATLARQLRDMPDGPPIVTLHRSGSI